MSQAINFGSMATAVGGVGFGVVASVPKIGKSIVKNGKKIKELFGDSKKITNKVEDLFDDLEGWFKKVKDKDAIEGGSKAKEIVGTEHNIIKPTQEIVNRERVAFYKQKLLKGEKIEPIEVYEIEGKGLYLQEGHHRYVASVETGIPVEIKKIPHGGPAGMPDWKYVDWKEYVNEEQFWED